MKTDAQRRAALVHGVRPCTLLAALAVAIGLTTPARADDEDAAAKEAARPPYSRGLVELKRQATSRGTPEETTKTNLKVDYFPAGGNVSLLRVELPFPDKKTSFAGSPFDPEFGDAKIRVGFRAFDLSGRPVTSFIELTFPTADPSSQGTGRYQASLGLKTLWQLGRGLEGLGSPKRSFSVQVQQVVAFAGDATRKDIDQTKFELEWRDVWAPGHYVKATGKPVIDWVGHGQTGATLDLEAGWWINPRWTLALLGGGLLWGKGVPSTYDGRLELKLIRRY